MHIIIINAYSSYTCIYLIFFDFRLSYHLVNRDLYSRTQFIKQLGQQLLGILSLNLARNSFYRCFRMSLANNFQKISMMLPTISVYQHGFPGAPIIYTDRINSNLSPVLQTSIVLILIIELGPNTSARHSNHESKTSMTLCKPLIKIFLQN